MSMDDRVAARIDDDTRRRVASVCDKYDMNESQIVRLCLRYGLETVEQQGLDAIVEQSDEETVA